MKAATTLRPLEMPPQTIHELPNGLTTHLVRRGALPLVAVRLMLPHGSVSDPQGRSGTAEFVARLMRRGAAGMTADQISEAIDFVGASMNGSVSDEYLVFGLTTPTQHLEAMLELMSTLVREPTFPEKELELYRRRTLAQLQNDLDDPGELADRALARAQWGDHPYGRGTTGSSADVAALSLDDIRRFHAERVSPSRAHLFVVGDFDEAQVARFIDHAFGSWSGATTASQVIPSWSGIAKAGSVVIVDKPEQTQVQVRIGARGVPRGHPHHFSLTVMNGVLGGSFTSRLMREIRVKRGLSYGASSGFDMLSIAGTHSVTSFTKTETVGTLLDVALGEVAKMKAKGPTSAEVETVKRYIAGLYPGRLETNESFAASLADVQHYGLPADWIQQYRERINAVSAKDAAAAAAEHLSDGGRAIVLVGNAEALRTTAAKYGEVSVVSPQSLA